MTIWQLRLKMLRLFVRGLVLIAVSLWMTFHVGCLKKTYFNWKADPKQNAQQVRDNWDSIRWLADEHPVIWEIAPSFPPTFLSLAFPRSGAPSSTPFTWSLLTENWRLLPWLVLFYSGVWSLGAANLLFILDGEVRREKLKEQFRQAQGLGGTGGSTTSVNIRTEIAVRAAESGNLLSANGAVLGTALGTVLAELIVALFRWAALDTTTLIGLAVAALIVLVAGGIVWSKKGRPGS
jgi:hypothetical protein